MAKQGRQPYVATVHGEVDGVPFTNWFKYKQTAINNCADDPKYIMTCLITGDSFKWCRRLEALIQLNPAPDQEAA